MIRNYQKNPFDPAFAGRGNKFDPMMNRFNGYNNANGSGSSATSSGAGSTVQTAAQGQKMQVNVTINNANGATPLMVELWNWLTSYVKILNPAYATGHYLYIPLTTFEGFAAFAGGHGGTIGWSDNGNLIINGDTSVPDPAVTVKCREVPYVSFFEASSISPFQVANFRYTVKSDEQIDNNITWFQKTFSGGVKQNPINPRSYFKPTQFQSLIIDITVSFTIGLDSGISLLVNASETDTLSLFIEMWTVQGIGQA